MQSCSASSWTFSRLLANNRRFASRSSIPSSTTLSSSSLTRPSLACRRSSCLQQIGTASTLQTLKSGTSAYTYPIWRLDRIRSIWNAYKELKWTRLSTRCISTQTIASSWQMWTRYHHCTHCNCSKSAIRQTSICNYATTSTLLSFKSTLNRGAQKLSVIPSHTRIPAQPI